MMGIAWGRGEGMFGFNARVRVDGMGVGPRGMARGGVAEL